MKRLLNNIYWFFYKLTPRGRKAFMFKQAIEGFKTSKRQTNQAKFEIIQDAAKKLKPKKILAFTGGKSVVKSKKTKHQVIQSVKHDNQAKLKERGLTITKDGNFANA